MRAVLVAALVVLSSGLLPAPGSAQSAEPFLADPEGDTELVAVGGGAPAKAPFTAADAATVDITAFDIVESDTALDLVLKLKSLKSTAGFADYAMHFTWGKVGYVVGVGIQNVPGVGQRTWSYLATEEDGWDWRAQLEHEIDVEKGVIRVPLEKAYILDQGEDVPGKGDVLKDAYAEAHLRLLVISGFFGEVADRAPDGEGGKPFTLQVGNFHSGSLRADAQHPVRVSNGGSTTFVYKIELSNTAEASQEVEARPESLPEGWNVTVQSPIRLAAEESKTVAVLASVPFGHTHGGFDNFVVNFTSRTDPGSRASVRLGVLHTPIPQPAGHHSELYLHTAKEDALFSWGGWRGVTMSTDSAHDGDEAEAPAAGNDGGGTIWWIALNPRLAMGLDFDLEKTGTLAGSVIGRATGEAAVSAELFHGPKDAIPWGDELLLLADAEPQKVTLDLSAPKAFSLVLTPTEDADYVPFDPEANLFLKVTLETDSINACCLPETAPTLQTGDFKMVLPLNEYHDKLTGAAEAVALVDLVAEGPVEKLGRPGTVMTYAFTLKNGGGSPAAFEVDLAGTDAAVGTLVPEGAIELGPGESRKLTLAVAIPAEAKEGQELEVLLFAHARDDPGRSAIARTKTTVTLGGEASADETDLLVAARADAERDTPGPALPLVALALVGAALLAARRRREAVSEGNG